jgi:hypothetical protein
MKALNLKPVFRPHNLSRQIIDKLKRQMLAFSSPSRADFKKLERYNRSALLAIASSHNIPLALFTATKDCLKTVILTHLACGDCIAKESSPLQQALQACHENIESLLGTESIQHAYL